jgi:hypothetical protein
MEYNKCKTCGAKNGRAGMLINGECMNCYKTRKNKEITLDTSLQRTDEEVKKTFAILGEAL